MTIIELDLTESDRYGVHVAQRWHVSTTDAKNIQETITDERKGHTLYIQTSPFLCDYGPNWMGSSLAGRELVIIFTIPYDFCFQMMYYS